MNNTYLIAHFGTGMNVKAQVVVGQLGGLFLQLPGESDLPVARKTQTHLYERLKPPALKSHMHI